MSWKVTIAPTSEPITTDEAKKQCEIETSVTAHDTFIDSLIVAARVYVENKLGIGLFTQTVVHKWNDFPGCTKNNPFGALKLTFGEIQSVAHVKYNHADTGVLTTLTVTTDYVFDNFENPAIIYPAYDTNWPDTRNIPNAVEAQYIRGWSTTAAIPQVLKQAMLLMIYTWFECRHDSVKRFPAAADILIDQYKTRFLW